MKFALFFGNRSFMPGELIKEARKEITQAVKESGNDYIMMSEDSTKYGGVETREEGRIYAKWLREKENEVDGIILCMPIFIDENGVAAALEKANVPILLQAYPDEIGKMGFKNRRDAFCGKFSVTDVMNQYKIPFTILSPHVVNPLTKEFNKNLTDFSKICKVVKGMKKLNIGVIGARTTAFKTVRFDEVTCQRHGINIESFDLSELFYKIRKLDDSDIKVIQKMKILSDYANFTIVPPKNKLVLAKMGVVLDWYIEEYRLDALSIRCWNEMETELRICPCVLISELNNRGIVTSCETDLTSAISMKALSLASDEPSACLDWNNNYGDEKDKVILFHCGSAADKLMAQKGHVTEHKMFAKVDPGSGWGTNEGRLKAFPMTYSNVITEDGKISIYFDEGEITEDVIEQGYFGCAGVAKINNLENKLYKLARNGFKHHTTISIGHNKKVLEEAFKYYLHYNIVEIG